jgi:predicted Zn-dependent protease with MMP-like domain
MTRKERQQFDTLFEQVLNELPQHLHEMLDETPVIVEDCPSVELLAELEMDRDEDVLCGLHSGTPLTERSVSHSPDLPETIHIFREGIIQTAGGWDAGYAAISREIRITLLHEIGHHFGLDEDDLEKLGYA